MRRPLGTHRPSRTLISVISVDSEESWEIEVPPEHVGDSAFTGDDWSDLCEDIGDSLRVDQVAAGRFVVSGERGHLLDVEWDGWDVSPA